MLGRDTGGPAGRRQNEEGHAPEDYDKFIDLVQKMLVYDPRHRIKPDEALTHRFFERKSSSSASVSSATVSAGSVPAEGELDRSLLSSCLLTFNLRVFVYLHLLQRFKDHILSQPQYRYSSCKSELHTNPVYVFYFSFPSSSSRSSSGEYDGVNNRNSN